MEFDQIMGIYVVCIVNGNAPSIHWSCLKLVMNELFNWYL
jgi:hypothetical protein